MHVIGSSWTFQYFSFSFFFETLITNWRERGYVNKYRLIQYIPRLYSLDRVATISHYEPLMINNMKRNSNYIWKSAWETHQYSLVQNLTECLQLCKLREIYFRCSVGVQPRNEHSEIRAHQWTFSWHHNSMFEKKVVENL